MYPARAFFRFTFTRGIAALLTPWLGRINPCVDLPARFFPVPSAMPARAHRPVLAPPLAARRIDRRASRHRAPTARPFPAASVSARYWFREECARATAHPLWALRSWPPGPL